MRALLLLVLLLGARCHPADEPEPSAPCTCESACARLREMRCAEAEPTDLGETCEDICGNAAQSRAPLPVECLATARSCSEAAQCGED